jgi:multiple antibiotic resistance protein
LYPFQKADYHKAEKMHNDPITFAVLSFTSYFTLINPLGVMPVFMTMTSSLTDRQRRRTAQKALIVAFFSLIGFALSGQLMFNLFGISVNSFRIVGGIIFFIMGKDMLQAQLTRVKLQKSEVREYIDDISVTPLAIPMIAGPGAITNSIVLMQDAVNYEMKAVLFGVIFAVCLLTYLILWGSSTIIRLLGDTGNKVMMRLMGLIVMVIAVEFFFSGLKPIIIDIAKGIM